MDKNTVLKVSGMTCPSCIRHVRAALSDVDGVGAVEVQLKEGQVAVQHDATVEIPELVEALREAGYEATGAT